MNIALIRPPKISGAFEKILIQEPINLAYLAAFLKKERMNVYLWDFEVEPFSEDILREKIAAHEIQIAGITSMTPTINNAHSIALTLKKINPEIKIICGGPHVSALPEESLSEFPCFDYVVIGEGEITLLELCRHIQESKADIRIPAIAYRKNKTVIINPSGDFIQELDSIPFPDRSILNPKLYKNIYAAGINIPFKRSTVVFTSRGCAQNCTFCAVKKTSGSTVRFRSAENVLAELTECKDKYGYSHITFEDTNLTLNRNRFLKICASLKNLGLTWDCQTKVNLIDEKLIKVMKDCGCLKIAYGVESGSPKILKLMNKNITIPQIKKAFALTHKAKIAACAFFILGSHPEETALDIHLTETLLRQIRPEVFQLGIICPYPGTEIYSIMKKEGLINEFDWNKLNFMHSLPQWGTKYISSRELIKFQKKIYIRYMLSPGFISSILKKLLNPLQLPHICRLSFSMFKYLFLEAKN